MTHFAHTADPFYSYAKKNPTLLMNKPPYNMSDLLLQDHFLFSLPALPGILLGPGRASAGRPLCSYLSTVRF